MGPFLALLTLGCRSQWIVTLDTDANVPQMGDQVLVDIFGPDLLSTCDGCRRILAADAAHLWPLRFGIVATETPLYVRARLYRGDHPQTNGVPDVAYLDALGKLPGSAMGRAEVHLSLSMDCFSVQADLAKGSLRACDPKTSTLEPVQTLGETLANDLLAPNTWAKGVPTHCDHANIPEDMVALPGGAFLLGGVGSYPTGGTHDTLPESLVIVRPFAMDRYEFSVADFYRHRSKVNDLPARRRAGGYEACTYPSDDQDQRPLTCVNAYLAQTLCRVQGKRLPTEAEWEWAAGNLTKETRYPFGNVPNDEVCGRAVVARGRDFDDKNLNTLNEDSTCRTHRMKARPPGVVDVTEDVGDRTELGISHLAGNVSEWVLDDFSPYGSGCWARKPGARVSPLCLDSEAYPAIHGGNWRTWPNTAQTITRTHLSPGPSVNEGVGFRCVKDL